MRIDEWLHVRGYFESRSRAKIAVRKGYVLVNGRKVKPSYNLRGYESIDILTESNPAGYYKLKELDARWKIFEDVKTVLDLGSSAGGFLIYASEKSELVFGIEYSREFEQVLRKIESERDNVRVFIADAFTFDVESLPHFDLILCDLTLEPEDAFKAPKRYAPRLKGGGKAIFVSKDREIEMEDFEMLDVVKSEEKREWYYLLEKNNNEAMA